MNFDHPLAPFWRPFGSLWHPFGSLLAPVGSLLAPFRHRLLYWFLKAFLMEDNPKKAPISRCRMLRFWHLFRDLFQRSICLCISVTLLLPLGYLLAPFWFVFVSFWLPFGTVWLSFAHLRVLFSHFGPPSVIFKFYYTSNANLTEVKEFCANCS